MVRSKTSQQRSPFAIQQVTIKILLSTAAADFREQSGLRRDASTVNQKVPTSAERIFNNCSPSAA